MGEHTRWTSSGPNDHRSASSAKARRRRRRRPTARTTPPSPGRWCPRCSASDGPAGTGPAGPVDPASRRARASGVDDDQRRVGVVDQLRRARRRSAWRSTAPARCRPAGRRARRRAVRPTTGGRTPPGHPGRSRPPAVHRPPGPGPPRRRPRSGPRPSDGVRHPFAPGGRRGQVVPTTAGRAVDGRRIGQIGEDRRAQTAARTRTANRTTAPATVTARTPWVLAIHPWRTAPIG